MPGDSENGSIMTRAQKGTVYLVGAGPGDPELLTIKGARLLQTADVIYHDDLVPEPILELARSTALVISVGKRCGAKRVTQAEIHNKLIESARRGMSVVRLKSGDPLIFGRAGEEMAALTAAQIAYEVVPGISAATAAAAAVRASLTSRDVASSVLIVTGHHVDKPGLVNRPEPAPTRIVFMPGPDLSVHAERWLKEGASPEMPCAVVSRISQPDQTIMRMKIGELKDAGPAPSPAVLIAGWALLPAGELASDRAVEALVAGSSCIDLGTTVSSATDR
jgi:uroporphyrin-III C-methyltransferase